MGKIAVFILKKDRFKGMEEETAQRVSRQLLYEGDGKTLDFFEMDKVDPLKIEKLREYKNYDVFVFIHGILFITHEGIKVLSRIALNRRKISVIVPVSNESKVLHQRHSPPFLYQTISVFRWAAEEIHAKFKDNVIEVDEIDDFCLVFRKDMLDGLPGEYNLIDLPQVIKNKGLRLVIAKGVYAHRYGNVYESGRTDIMRYIPLAAKDVLDIGCAGGLFGEMLKKRQKCFVTGVDTDTELINIAKGRLDNVINGDVEEVVDKGNLGIYDCIVCGDVLEHLNNPWKVVKGLKNHLRKGGLFIASVPNVMNWAIVYEMLQGRWDYVPFSILSGTHIRFFTRKTCLELFEKVGYKIKDVFLQSFDIPSRGVKFIAKMKKHMPETNEEELRASEIVVIAEN